MDFKKSEILEMSNEDLLVLLYDIGAREVRETNFGKGITKKTNKIKEWVLDELEKRFNVDISIMIDIMNRV